MTVGNRIYLTESQLVLVDEGKGQCDLCTYIYDNIQKTTGNTMYIETNTLSEAQIKHLEEMC